MDRIKVFKALAHPTRLQIIEDLIDGKEKCICEFIEEMDFEQSTISKHMAVLKNADLVISRKEGLKVFYRLKWQRAKNLLEVFKQDKIFQS